MSKGIVSVFGGSAPEPGSAAYNEAYEVGASLARGGYTVATGGYSGIMAAASQGAAEAGGHVIGVTTTALNSWEEKALVANRWVKEEIKFTTLRDRLYHLVTFCDAAVAVRGGIGTLSEVSLAWSLIQVGEIKRKPLVLLGKEWDDLLAQFYGSGAYIRAEDMKLLQSVHTPGDILGALSNGR